MQMNRVTYDAFSDEEDDRKKIVASMGNEEESEEEKKGVSDEVRTQRWFSEPMFEALASKKEEESDEEAIQAMKDAQRKSVKRALPLEERLRAYSGRWRGW